MRKPAVLALTFLSAPVWAAVLPVGVVARHGHPLSSVVSAPSTALVESAPSAALGGGGAQPSAAQTSPAAYRGEWTADTRNTWRGDDGETRVQFNLRTDAGDNRWGFGVRLGELAGFPAAALSSVATDVQFL